MKGGVPKPADVGTGGTKIEGNSLDNARGGKTVLLFTEGRAFVTIDFDAPAELFPPPPNSSLSSGRNKRQPSRTVFSDPKCRALEAHR